MFCRNSVRLAVALIIVLVSCTPKAVRPPFILDKSVEDELPSYFHPMLRSDYFTIPWHSDTAQIQVWFDKGGEVHVGLYRNWWDTLIEGVAGGDWILIPPYTIVILYKRVPTGIVKYVKWRTYELILTDEWLAKLKELYGKKEPIYNYIPKRILLYPVKPDKVVYQ